MFGQKTTFGSPAFGSGSAFGSQNSVLFGAKPTSPFAASAAQAPSTGLFGATTAAPSTNIFGGNAPSSSTGLFGMNSGFGQSGTSTLFGGSQAKPLFGSNTSSVFGSQPQTSTFGMAASQPGSTTGSLFGQPSTQPAGTLFGSTPTSTVSLFGSSVVPSGTTIKFEPVIASDTMLRNSIQTNISTKHQCITSMKQYENKSLEELRVEDYVQNRKGAQQSSALTSFGGIGTQPTTSGSIFGGSTLPSAGVSLFGQAQNKPTFGGSIFGSTQPTTALGQPATTTAGGTGLFGQSKPMFGSAQAGQPMFTLGATTKPGEGLFGQAQKPGGLFGSTPATTTSAFATQPTFTFGQPQLQSMQPTGSIFSTFGTTPASTAPTTLTPSIFGGSTTGGSIFGSKPATTTTSNLFAPFGSTNTAPGAQQTSLFGSSLQSQQQQQQKSIFGGGGMFGQSVNVSKPAGSTLGSTGLFSQPASTGQGLSNAFKPTFSLGGTTPSSGLFGSAGSSFPASTTFAPTVGVGGGLTLGGDQSVQAAQEALIRSQLSLLANSPYGQSPILKLLDTQVTSPTNPAKQREALSLSMPASDALAKPKPLPPVRSYPRILLSNVALPSPGKSPQPSGILEELESKSAPSSSAGFVPKRNIKKLIIRSREERGSIQKASPVVNGFVHDLENSSHYGEASSMPMTYMNGSMEVASSQGSGRGAVGDSLLMTPVAMHQAEKQTERKRGGSVEERRALLGVVCSREDYYCSPSVDELVELMDDRGRCLVNNFTVGRREYGYVTWTDVLDVAGLNLDRLVHFEHREVTVYPENEDKPAVGHQLNRPAIVTLERVWPNDKTTGMPITDPMRIEVLKYCQKLEKACNRMKAKFVGYDVATGKWTFEVPHFSKYGLVNSESSDEEQQGEEAPSARDNVHQGTGEVLEMPSPIMPVRDGGQIPMHMETISGEFFEIPEAAFKESGPSLKKAKVVSSTEALLDELYEKTEQMLEASHLTKPGDMSLLKSRRVVAVKARTVGAVRRGRTLFDPKQATRECLPYGYKATWLTGRCVLRQRSDTPIGVLEMCTAGDSDHQGRLTAMLPLHDYLVECSKAGADSGRTIPTFQPAHYCDIGSCLDRMGDANCDHPLWSSSLALCKALFGPMQGDDCPEGRVVAALRENQVKRWLREENEKFLEENLTTGRMEEEDLLLYHLLAGDVEKAVVMARAAKNNRLALMIAAAGSDSLARELLLEQLEVWRRTKADKHIDIKLLKVYVALAGHFVWNGSKEVRLFDDLPWPFILSFILWFSHKAWHSVSDALELCSEVASGRTKVEYHSDLRYHMLKIFSDGKHHMESVLNSLTVVFDLFDFRMSWFMWYVLSAVGFRPAQPDSIGALHLAYANQLEDAGLWLHSAFVLMHIESEQLKTTALQNLLIRCRDNLDCKSRSMLRRFGIAETVLCDAVALHDALAGRWQRAFKNHLTVGNLKLAQNLLAEHIAPELYIRGKFSELNDLVDAFASVSPVSSPAVCQDIAQLCTLPSFLEAKDKELINKFSDSDELRQLLCRIPYLPASNEIQRLFRGRASALVICALWKLLPDSEYVELTSTFARKSVVDEHTFEELTQVNGTAAIRVDFRKF